MTRFLTVAVSAIFVLGACGDSSASGTQGEVADLFIDVANEEGLSVDERCIRDTTADLSDDDAQALVDAGLEGDAEISEEGDAIGEEIFSSCVDPEQYVDFIVESFTQNDDTIDGDCLRDELGGMSVNEVDEKLFDAAFACTAE